jgi:hypothetical protein
MPGGPPLLVTMISGGPKASRVAATTAAGAPSSVKSAAQPSTDAPPAERMLSTAFATLSSERETTITRAPDRANSSATA